VAAVGRIGDFATRLLPQTHSRERLGAV
jgi:hypothetical protein